MKLLTNDTVHMRFLEAWNKLYGWLRAQKDPHIALPCRERYEGIDVPILHLLKDKISSHDGN